jgi:GTP-binding protein
MDKLKRSEVDAKLSKYQNKMLETWEELPQMFETSAEKNLGREDLLHYIDALNRDIGQKFK